MLRDAADTGIGFIQADVFEIIQITENTNLTELSYSSEKGKTDIFIAGLNHRINNPDASVGAQCSTFRTVCSHKVVAVGFNTLCYDASVGVLNPHE